jgi:hypothetical protein
MTASKNALILLATLTVSQPGFAQEQTSWTQYVDRSGTRVAFPVDVFPSDAGPAEQGRGQRFRTNDGRAQLAIYTLPNPLRESPATYLRNRLRVSTAMLKYRRVTPRFYALSSARDGFIYYSRCNFARQIHCIYMTYPEHEKRAWDSVVTRVSNSLRSG